MPTTNAGRHCFSLLKVSISALTVACSQLLQPPYPRSDLARSGVYLGVFWPPRTVLMQLPHWSGHPCTGHVYPPEVERAPEANGSQQRRGP